MHVSSEYWKWHALFSKVVQLTPCMSCAAADTWNWTRLKCGACVAIFPETRRQTRTLGTKLHDPGCHKQTSAWHLNMTPLIKMYIRLNAPVPTWHSQPPALLPVVTYVLIALDILYMVQESLKQLERKSVSLKHRHITCNLYMEDLFFPSPLALCVAKHAVM